MVELAHDARNDLTTHGALFEVRREGLPHVRRGQGGDVGAPERWSGHAGGEPVEG